MDYKSTGKRIALATGGYILGNVIEKTVSESVVASTGEYVAYYPGWASMGVGVGMMAKGGEDVKIAGLGCTLSGTMSTLMVWRSVTDSTSEMLEYIGA